MAQLQSTAVTGSLTTTGNVGIGTASPNSYNGYTTLTLNGSTGGVVDFESGGSRIATINNPGSGLDIYTMVAAPIVFGTNVNARMTITGGGNVGISTTNPTQRLQIGNLTSTSTGTPESFSLGGTYSNSAGNNPKIRLWEDGTYYMGFGISSDQLNYMLGRTIYRHVFYADGNPLMTILGTGNVGIGTTNPSYKLHIDGNSSGLNLSGGNNRIYFSGYRALEGSTDGGNLQIGEGYSQISLQSGTIGISTTVTQAQFYIYNNNSYSAANINETTGSLMAFRIRTRTGVDTNIVMGAFDSTQAGLQAVNASASATVQGFLINPYGGNVGISTTNPTLGTLQVGSTSVNSNAAIIGNATAGIEVRTNSAGGRIAALEQYFGNEGSLWLYLNNTTKVLLRANGNSYLNGGNLGIGTDNPGNKVHIYSGASGFTGTYDSRYKSIIESNGEAYYALYVPDNSFAGLRFNNSTATVGFIDYYHGTQGEALVYYAGNTHRFFTSGTEKVTINVSGNVGIGTTNPTYKLQVNGTLQASTLYTDRYIYDTGDTNTYLDFVSGDQFRIVVGGVEMWRWVEGGTDYSYTSFPVGIGTAVPLADLHIRDSTAIIRLESTSGPYSNISSNTVGSIEISADEGNTGASSNINFKVDGSDLMRLVNGNVGINNSSPQFKLHVLGTTGGDSTFNEGILIENSNATDGEPTLAFRVKSMAEGIYWFTGLNQSANYDIAYGSSFTNAGTIMRVTNTGNVGIGTVTPSRKLEVLEGSIQIVANFQNTSTVSSRIKFVDANTGAENVNIGAIGTKLAMWTNGTVKMTIISGGNVGIGTTNPTHLLHVNGTLRVDNAGSAPTIKDGTPPENYVGGAGYWLGEPSGWLAINVGGTPCVIPLYE